MANDKKCKTCKLWVFTTTLGSPDVPVWHCRSGFTPSEECQEQAEYNRKCIRDYYARHPNERQLKLKFK